MLLRPSPMSKWGTVQRTAVIGITFNVLRAVASVEITKVARRLGDTAKRSVAQNAMHVRQSLSGCEQLRQRCRNDCGFQR